MQLRFHTISGKNEAQTICDMVSIAEDFLKNTTKAKKWNAEKNKIIILNYNLTSTTHRLNHLEVNF